MGNIFVSPSVGTSYVNIVALVGGVFNFFFLKSCIFCTCDIFIYLSTWKEAVNQVTKLYTKYFKPGPRRQIRTRDIK